MPYQMWDLVCLELYKSSLTSAEGSVGFSLSEAKPETQLIFPEILSKLHLADSSASPVKRRQEPIPACTGRRRQVTPWTGLQAITVLIRGDKQLYNHTRTYGQFTKSACL